MNRTRLRRSMALIGVAVTAGLVLTACGGPTKAGSAATVGDERITTAELEAFAARSTADPEAKAEADKDKAGYLRERLTQRVTHLVLERAAASKGVDVTNGDVDAALANYVKEAGSEDAFYAAVAKNGYARDDVRGVIRDLLLGDALSAMLAKDEKLNEIHAAHILVADKAKAEELLAKVKADPSTFAALAKENSTDDSNKDDGGDLGWADPSRYVKPFADAISAAKDDSYITVQTEFGWHVIHVIAKRTISVADVKEDSPSFEQAQTIRQQKMSTFLSEFAKDLNITVSPRYGVWDPNAGRVVASKDELSSPDPTSTNGG